MNPSIAENKETEESLNDRNLTECDAFTRTYGESVENDKLKADYEELLNFCMRHTCSEKCLKNGKCRFKYPKDLQTETTIDYKKIKRKDGQIRWKIILKTKRNDGRLNSHNVDQLLGWRGNVDLQIIVDAEDCKVYTTKYVGKIGDIYQTVGILYRIHHKRHVSRARRYNAHSEKMV